MPNYSNEFKEWIKFNSRVIHEAERPSNPLMERLNFIRIADNNLDEFIRTKLNPEDEEVLNLVRDQTNKIENIYLNILTPELIDNGISIIRVEEFVKMFPEKEENVHKIFNNDIKPLLQTQILKESIPFPEMDDDASFIATEIDDDDNSFTGLIRIPENYLIQIKVKESDKKFYIESDSLIMHYIGEMYSGLKIEKNKRFRIFRKIESLSSSEEDKSYLKSIRKGLDYRKHAEIVMVDTSNKIGLLKGVLKSVKKRMRIFPSGLRFIEDIEVSNNSLYFDKMKSRVPVRFADQNMFDAIDDKPIIVHYPYESFEASFVRFLYEASIDPKVKCIKQTLYRVAKNSKIVDYLCQAAQNGKQVTVLLELKAKLDEEHNYRLIQRMQDAGVNIIYGVETIKTHAKICVVVRKSGDDLDVYSVISTGNFNETTAKVYEDIAIFIKDSNSKYAIGKDINIIFNDLGIGRYPKAVNDGSILVSPLSFKPTIISKFDKCIEFKKNNPNLNCEIRLKCNALTSTDIADKIYEAAEADVKVTLIVRGANIVIPSKNIVCKSVIGRFLEHSRIYEFIMDQDRTIYIGSGDMMPRNLEYRVEVLTSVYGRILKNLHNLLELYISDNMGSYVKDSNEVYNNPDDTVDNPISVQIELIKKYKLLEKEVHFNV